MKVKELIKMLRDYAHEDDVVFIDGQTRGHGTQTVCTLLPTVEKGDEKVYLKLKFGYITTEDPDESCYYNCCCE